MSSKGVKKFIEVAFVRKNIHASQLEVDFVIVKCDNKNHVTTWWREGEVPLLWTLPRGFRNVEDRIYGSAQWVHCYRKVL